MSEKLLPVEELEKGIRPVRRFGLLFILIGIVVICWGAFEFRLAKASENWAAVTGTVVASEVTWRTKKGSMLYRPDIRYEYVVGGQTYCGTRVAFEGERSSSDSTYARNVVNRYPQGMAVQVYYLPADPGVCVLEPGPKGGTWFGLVIGMLVVTFGSFVAIYLPVAIRKQNITPESGGYRR